MPIALLGIPLFIAAAGCQRTLPPESPPEFQGRTVKVACPEALRELLAGQSRSWQARQAARVEIQPYAAAAAPESAADADVWVFPPADLPRLAAANALRRVPERFTRRGEAFAWDRLLPMYGEHLTVWDRVPYAVPLVGEAPVCLYRVDLVASAAWQGRFAEWQKKQGRPGDPLPLRAPASWEELARQAKFFCQEHPSGRPGPSLPALPAGADALDRLFGQVAAPLARRAVRGDEQRGGDYRDEVFSFYFAQKDGRPRVGSPGFVRALEMLVRLQKCRPPGTADRPEEALLEGRAVLGVVEASVLARLQRSKMRDQFGACAVPGAEVYVASSGKEARSKQGVNRVPYLGGAGWLAAVPRSAARAEAAEDLLADLAGPARALGIAMEPRWGGGATRIDALLRDRWDAFDLDERRTAALREAVGRSLLQHGLENPALVLRLPDRAAFRDALVAGLKRSLLDGVAPRAALAEVDRRWQSLVKGRGPSHRRAYRQGQGLLGE